MSAAPIAPLEERLMRHLPDNGGNRADERCVQPRVVTIGQPTRS